MTNPNFTKNALGKIVEVERMTSLTVFKVQTKKGTFDYTVFGQVSPALEVGETLSVTIAYSITLNGYFIKHVNSILKVA